MTHYTGSCHCGAVKYSVELDLTQPVLECNCSHCQRKGFLLSFVPASSFELLSGDETMTEYRFNTHKIRHRFCPKCGVQCFGEGEHEGHATRAVNVRTIEDIDLSTLTRQPVDGKSF
ncbi:GFA family protein [Candidatus Gracilibacteria bacterium]|nr:GFA family protein [Candidatus Gracilibacteria bacterium]